MRKLFFTVISILTVTLFEAQQNPYFQWAKAVGGTNNDKANSITHDVLGNIYITGDFEGTVDFDPGPGTFTMVAVAFNDVFILKLDPVGNFIWAKSFGGADGETGKSISVDALGNVYTSGYYRLTVDFDPGPGTFSITSAGVDDIFISKLDALGNFVWAKSMGGTIYDYGYSLTVDAVGNVYTTGNFQGTADFDPGIGTYTLSVVGPGDYGFISKLDVSGNFVWAKSIGGSAFCYGRSISVDVTGNVFSTGLYGGIVDFDPGVGTYTLNSPTGYDIYILKLDVSGNFVWVKGMGGTGYDTGNSIVLDGSGNIFTTGRFQNTVDFDPGVGTYTLSCMGSDVFVSKLDASGNFVWAKNMGGTNSSTEAQCISLDALGNVYTTGYYDGTTDFDPGVTTFTLAPVGTEDVFISKLTSSGNFAWAKSIGSAGLFSGGNALTVDALSNVYTAGYFQGLTDFGIGQGNFTLTANGQYDVFVHKIGQCILPSVPANVTSFTNQNICDANSTTLSANSTGTINWYSTPTSTVVLGSGTNFITPTLSVGNYTYYAEAATCTVSVARTPVTVTANICLGVQERINENAEFKIYPNPVNDLCTFDVESLVALESVIEIVNSLGQKVLNEKFETRQASFNLSKLSPGIYFASIKQGVFVKTVKLIKE